MKKKTTQEFIKEANIIHNNKYDYSLSTYKTNNTKVKIICPIHGVFEQTPVKHILAKHCCPKCSNIKLHNIQRKDKNTFILESKNIHKDKYDYSLVEYINNRTKIKIICPIHGVFEQTPINHLKGKGCKYCGGTSKLDTNFFIYNANKIHNNFYDYSLVDYLDSRTKIKIICPIHGVFEQTPNNHLSKEQGCFNCLNKIHDNITFSNYCSLLHNNKYDYSLVNYTLITNKVKIICPIHGAYEQRADSHKNGNGCNKCSNNGVSKEEKELNNWLNSLGIITETNDKNTLNGLELDIYIPSHNLAIEYNGLYWHSEEFIDKNYHINKTELCEKQNIQLIHIFEDEWLFKKDIVKSRLMNILGLTTNKIYGRKTEIREVSSKKSKEFLDANHIQGNVNSKIKLGLYYKDELVSIMTIGKRPMINNYEYELLRFCNKLNTNVIGGADKLLKNFIKTYEPKQIISYADRRWSQGNLYEKLGFNFKNNSIISFSYIINKKRVNRLNLQKHILVKQGFDSNKTAKQIMLDRKIYRIYDCGSKSYELIF
jgi:hypothetical protein